MRHRLAGEIQDRDLFDRAQRRRETAKETSPRNTRHKYLLRGHTRCAECGYRMHATTHRTVSKGRAYTYRYYRCPQSVPRDHVLHKCDTIVFSVEQTDAAVWAEIKAILTEPARLDAAFEHSQGADAVQQLETQLEQANRNIETSKRRLDRLIELYLDGHYTQDALRQQQRKIEDSIQQQVRERDRIAAQLNDTADRLRQMQGVQEFARQFKERLATADKIFERRRWIVDVLNVTVRLGVVDEVKTAYLDIGGTCYSTLSLGRVKRQKNR